MEKIIHEMKRNFCICEWSKREKNISFEIML